MLLVNCIIHRHPKRVADTLNSGKISNDKYSLMK